MSGHLKSLVKTWSRGHTQQQGSLGNVVLHLGKCHLRTTRNLCHKRIAGVIKGECLYFLLHLSSLFHYFIIFMYHLRKFQKSIFGKKKKKLIWRKCFEMLIVVIAFQWLGYTSLHLYVSPYFQIWLKWECVAFIFRKKKIPSHTFTIPFLIAKKRKNLVPRVECG